MAQATLRSPAPLLSRLRASPGLLLCVPAAAVSIVLVGALVIMMTYSFYTFDRGRLVETFTFASWTRYLADSFFWDILGRSVQLAAVITFVDLLIAFPAAYAITKVKDRRVLAAIYVAIFSPLVVSSVVRTFGWLGVLADQGLVNRVLLATGVIAEPLKLVFNLTGVEIAMVHAFVPFMVFPLLGSLRQIETRYREAALDLGATSPQTFLRVVLPLSLPGILAGCQVVFTLAVSAFVTPELMGGGRVIVASRLAWESVTNLDWPRGAIQVFSLLAVTITVFLVINILSRRTYLGHLRGRG